MAQVTPGYQLPFPDPGDRVRNGSTDMRALAERTETVLAGFDQRITAGAPIGESWFVAGQIDFGQTTPAGGGSVYVSWKPIQSSPDWQLEAPDVIRYLGAVPRWFTVSATVTGTLGTGVYAPGSPFTMTATLRASGNVVMLDRLRMQEGAFDDINGSGTWTGKVATPIRLAGGDALQLEGAGTTNDREIRFASAGLRLAAIGPS